MIASLAFVHFSNPEIRPVQPDGVVSALFATFISCRQLSNHGMLSAARAIRDPHSIGLSPWAQWVTAFDVRCISCIAVAADVSESEVPPAIAIPNVECFDVGEISDDVFLLCCCILEVKNYRVSKTPRSSTERIFTYVRS